MRSLSSPSERARLEDSIEHGDEPGLEVRRAGRACIALSCPRQPCGIRCSPSSHYNATQLNADERLVLAFYCRRL